MLLSGMSESQGYPLNQIILIFYSENQKTVE